MSRSESRSPAAVRSVSRSPVRSAAAALCLLTATGAGAHVGVVNTQLPYAVAGKTYELVLAIPHGCPYTPPDSAVAVELDTYRVEVKIPPGFTGVRPIIDGVFGRPALARDAGGAVTTVTWTKAGAYDSAEDDQSYRVALRVSVPGAPFTSAQFGTRQLCRRPGGGEDVILDWTAYTSATGAVSNQSPTVKILPPRQPGWNRYNLAAGNEKHTLSDVQAFLSTYLADAQIVWVGKRAYSANPSTAARIKALAAKDGSYSELATQADAMIHATDDIWVKY